MRAIVSALAIFGFITPVFAGGFGALGPIPGEEKFASMNQSDEFKGSAGGGLGFSKIDEDSYLQLTVGTEFAVGKLGIGLAVPLNLRVIDEDPKSGGTFEIREEDWDETSDYLKAIRYLSYGYKRDTVYLRVGELAAEIGHGTIMSRYMNNTDINTFRVGSQFDLNTMYGGFETIINDYGAFGEETTISRIVGGRVYIKPFGIANTDPEAEGEGVLNSVSVGFSYIADLNAPLILRTDPTTFEPIVNDRGNYGVDTDDSQNVTGFDLEVEVLNTPILTVVPYLDYNFIKKAGSGMHLGVLTTFTLPVGFTLSIPVRLEYRRFDQDYIPAYFGTFYENERFNVGLNTPKAAAIRAACGAGIKCEGINGYYADAAFGFAGWFQIGAIYEDYEGSNPNFAAFMTVPALETIQFKAYYTRLQVQDFGDVFKLDERSLLIAQARYQVYPYVYLVGRFTRRWQLVPSSEGGDGQYESVDDWNAGLEFSFSF